MGVKYLADDAAQAIAHLRTLAGRSASPGVKARLGDAQHPTYDSQGVGHELRQYKGVFHRLSLAKYAAAFFRMLTSIRERDNSARNRVISACSGLTARRPAATVN